MNVLIIGAGGVAHVAAHKCAQNNDILGNICIASRTLSKCDAIVESINKKGSIKDPSKSIYTHHVDALQTPQVVQLIKRTNSSIVLNLGSAFVNMSVLEACIQTGAAYLDTAIHEEPDRVAAICEPPPWYGNYEWKRKDRCTQKGISAILGLGFDPGVVNAYAALANRELFDSIESIDIIDVNAGHHGRYFATNFDPEINFREFVGEGWQWINKNWVSVKPFTRSMTYDLPEVGKQTVYLTGHDELHSLSKNIDANSIRFWMGFSDHYINVFTVLNNLGLLSEKPVITSEGEEVIPLKVIKACLPDPMSLAENYTGKTCIGTLIRGKNSGKTEEIFIYNICDHEQCYKELGSQAISYTAGVPVVAGALLLAQGIWNPPTMVNVEELNPRPFINLIGAMGLTTQIKKQTLNEYPFHAPVTQWTE